MTASRPAETPTEEPQGLELFLLKLRYTEGRLRTVEGNTPLLLDDPTTVWVIYTGTVDLFVVPVAGDAPSGARTHLFRAGVGTLLFGLPTDPTAPDLRLLASGTPGTRLVRLEIERLRALAAELEHTALIATLLDQWIVGLSAALGRTIPPKAAVALEPGQKLAVPGGQVVVPKHGVLWVAHVAGQSRFMSRAELPPVTGPQPLPLARHTWLEAAGPVTLATQATEAWLATDPAWAALTAFHVRAWPPIRLNWQEATAREQVRLQHKATAQREALEGAVARLAGLLEPTIAPPEPRNGAPDRLLQAARLVGQAQGIEIVPPGGGGAGATHDAVHQIAHASRIRLRQVALAGDWWRHDNGPLLAFRAATGSPVALLMPAPGRYTLAAPGEPGRPPVDRAVAATLAPSAYLFYRPFPAQVLTVWDVLRFGLHEARRDLRTIVVLGLLMGLLGLLPPVATGLIVDLLIPGAARDLLLQVGGGLLIVALATALFQVTRSIAMLRVEGKADAALQAAVWDRLLSLPVPFFRDYTSGDLAVRAMGITTIRQILSGTVLTTILTSLFSVFNLALLFYYHAALALVATGLVLVSMVITFLAGTLQLRHQRRLVAEEGQIAGLVLQLINGIARFRVAGAEARAFALWAARFSRQRALAYQARTVANHLGVFNLVYPILTTMVIFAMVSVTHAPGFTTGRFLAFNAAFVVLLLAGLRLSGACLSLLNIVPIYERAKPILQTLPEVDAGKGDPGELTGEIEVNQLSFRYKPGGALILKEISLRIQPGEFVALVGPSGSGKSTLLRLLLGFETPESGGIYYDRRDLAGLDPRAVRQQIGVVLQNGQLLAGDIFQNILGGTALTLDAAWTAARQAGLDEEIRAMPMGMHTVIGEGGGTLSGGQRQRLLIARALVKRPRILFFDEATSALDNRTQEIISRSLLDLRATRVVIAHRLSTILSADRIVVLDGGRVVQAGTYSELIDQPGLFADLAKRQML